MPAPRFSVLIPTRDRPHTFGATLKTVVSQPGDDYEIVVADNCSGPQTRQLVESLGRGNIRYTRSDEILPMAENWERGLDLCSGEFVTVLGDDDGFLPSTLAMARRLIDRTSPELFAWMTHTYWWPDTIVHWARNKVVVELNSSVVAYQSRAMLEKFYRGEIAFGHIPMIYNAFFHRGIIEEARIRYDGFFVPRDTAPDVSSGILGLHLTGQFIYSDRPLTIRGNSGRSNGVAQWARHLGAEQREVYYREERMGLERIIHKSLIPSPDLNIVIASAKLKCRDVFFPDDPALQVDLPRLVREMIATLNFEPEAYEDRLRDIHALAAKIGMRIDPADIPPMHPRDRRPWWGPVIQEDRSVPNLNVNGALAGVSDIEGAARLAESLVPPAERYLED